MLIAENIYKSYGNLPVLKGVSLKIDMGEMVSIIGPSGAGKSTFLHILSSLDEPNEGIIYFKNQPLKTYSQKQLANFRNQNIGLVFQFHHLLPEFSAIENVSIPAWIAKKNKKKTQERATYLLELLQLKDRLNHKPNQLSGGEQQRVAVARALINEPSILFADEPTGNLDSANAVELTNYFLKLKKELNTSFCIVTHNPELAELSDRTLTMKDGLIL